MAASCATSLELEKDERGAVLIEFALVFPILLATVMGVLAFGQYFLKSDIVLRAVNNVVYTLQLNPLTPQDQLVGQLRSYGSNIITFSVPRPLLPYDNGNYLCVDIYATLAEAEAADPLCADTHFNMILKENVPPGSPAYMIVRANLPETHTNLFSGIMNLRVMQSSGIIPVLVLPQAAGLLTGSGAASVPGSSSGANSGAGSGSSSGSDAPTYFNPAASPSSPPPAPASPPPSDPGDDSPPGAQDINNVIRSLMPPTDNNSR